VAELARGKITDRPWGRTLAALGLREVSGQLTLAADGKRYQIAFAHGAIVGAMSPLGSDAAVRVALTGGLLSSTQVADVSRRQAAAPQRDEVELIAELVRLAPDQALRLRRRTIAQRAARTFSVERGEFVVEDQLTLPLFTGTELDVRSVIYLGARQNLSEARLGAELAQLGAWFKLRPESIEDLPQFGFTDTEQAVIERLFAGAALAELETCGVDPRAVHATLYALVSCNACEVERPVERAAAPVDAPKVQGRPRTGTSRPPTTRRRPSDSAQAADVRTLIAHRLELLRDGTDHFALLGVGQDARPEALRKAYFALARQLHPDRLAALQIDDEGREAQRLFAQINTAFTTLADPRRREDYVQILRRGGEASVRAEQAKAEQLTARLLEAEEAFRRGELALRRDQVAAAITELAHAVALDPDEADYQAVHAWAQFCGSADKQGIAQPTRTSLERAIAKSPSSTTARFYLGRVERMLGRDREALRHFQEVLAVSPSHPEAGAEIRMIEARLAGAAGRKR
jgi:tetratricopeptide (TPR) repeat protein